MPAVAAASSFSHHVHFRGLPAHRLRVSCRRLCSIGQQSYTEHRDGKNSDHQGLLNTQERGLHALARDIEQITSPTAKEVSIIRNQMTRCEVSWFFRSIC
jgi:hypothetical protein